MLESSRGSSRDVDDDLADVEMGEGDKLEQELFARCFETEDKAEGMASFIEKRKPVFKGR